MRDQPERKREDQKKPYRTPRLVAYGTLREITMTTAKGGHRGDGGGSNPATKV